MAVDIVNGECVTQEFVPLCRVQSTLTLLFDKRSKPDDEPSTFRLGRDGYIYKQVYKPEGKNIYNKDIVGYMRLFDYSLDPLNSMLLRHTYYRAQRVSCIFNRRGDKANSEKWAGWRAGNLRPLFEPILWFMKPYRIGGTLTDNLIENEVGAYNANILTQNIIKVKVEQTDTGLHPTQKPLSLMETLILLTTCVGQTVLDPFCGSGTTLVAAKNLGRKYIGIEISAEYCNVAQSRLQQI